MNQRKHPTARVCLPLLVLGAIGSATTGTPRSALAGERSGQTRFALVHTVARLFERTGLARPPATELAQRYGTQALAHRLDAALQQVGARSPNVPGSQPERAEVRIPFSGGTVTLMASSDGRLGWNLRVGRGYPDRDSLGVGHSTTLLDAPDGRATLISVFAPVGPNDAALSTQRQFAEQALPQTPAGTSLHAALLAARQQLAGRELSKRGRVWAVASVPGERPAGEDAAVSTLDRLLSGADARGHLPNALRIWLERIWAACTATEAEATLLLGCVEPYRQQFDDAGSPQLTGLPDRALRELLEQTAAVGRPATPLTAVVADPVLAYLAAMVRPAP